MDSIDLKISYAPNSHITAIKPSFAGVITLSYLTVMIPCAPCKYFFSGRSQGLHGKQGDECPGVSQTELDAYVLSIESCLQHEPIWLEKWPFPKTTGERWRSSPAGLQKSLQTPFSLSPFNSYLFLFISSSSPATGFCNSASCYLHPLSPATASQQAAAASEK